MTILDPLDVLVDRGGRVGVFIILWFLTENGRLAIAMPTIMRQLFSLLCTTT